MEFLYIYLISLAFFTLWYIVAQVKNNNGLVDIAWGLGIVISAISSLIIGAHYSVIGIIITILTTIWGLRLSMYLFVRNFNKKEDYRYTNMKIRWKTSIKVKSYFYIFFMQSIINFVIALPIILTNLNPESTLNIINISLISVGIVVFLLGFIFEVLADHSLQRFKKDPKNKGQIMQSNVWKYSRHPNYFGESMIWWGIGLLAVSTLNLIGLLGLLSPIIITFLLVKVSGIPLLEKRYKDDPNYQVYKSKTSIFFPLPPKK